MQNILDHEQFEGAKELADIGLKISEGRALLGTLESSKEEFLATREHQAVERVGKVLAESAELIKAIGANHSRLVEYRREVNGFVDDLRYFIESVTKYKTSADAAIKEDSHALEEKRKEVEKLLLENKKISILNEAETQNIRRQRASLVEQTRKAQDEIRTLERVRKELKETPK